MDFFDVLRVLARRWYLVLVGLLLTGAGGYQLASGVETQYQAGAQYILLLPADAQGPKSPSNPYTNINAGLIFTAELISSEASTKAVQRELADDGFSAAYSVALGTSDGPVLDLTVKGTDQADVLATRDELLRRFDERLEIMQDIRGIPEAQVIFSRTNAVDREAEVLPGAKRRAIVLVSAVGLVVTLLLTFTVDGLLRRRSRIKAARPTP